MWSATRVASPEIVALKRPHHNDPVTFAHVLREARIGQYLHHPSVIATLGAGCDMTGWYVVLEYVDGPSLAALLAHYQTRGRATSAPPALPVGAARSLALQLCAGLQHIHTATDGDGKPLGIVHGDISPANILLTSTGHLKIADFGDATGRGLARAPRRGCGTPGYAAPEIRRRETFDHRADIHAAGRVVRALLACTVRPVDAALEAVLARATASDPADRHGDAAVLGAALSATWPSIPDDESSLELDIGAFAVSVTTAPPLTTGGYAGPEVVAWQV